MFALDTELTEYTFKTKERAQAFAKFVNEQTIHRLAEKARTRKSLPKFRGHKNSHWSVWVKAFSLCDSIGVTTYYKVYKEAYETNSNKP
jgi:hypothetical protein